MSLLATRMLEYRANEARIDKWETRPSVYGAYDVFKEQSAEQDGIIPQNVVEAAMSSIGRDTKIPVINFDSGVTISNSRSVTIADDENTSALYTVTWTTYAFGFTQVPTLFINNEIGAQRDFNAKMNKYIYKLGETLDSACIAALETAKTQQLSDDLGGKYSLSTNVVTGALATQDDIVGDLGPLQYGNDFYNPLHIVGNQSFNSLVRNRLLEKGQFNTENKTYQWQDKTFHFSNRVTNGAGIKATGFAIPKGSLGMLYRFEREVLANGRSRTGHEWGRDVLPILGLPMGTYYYESVDDYNAIAGAASADMDRVRKQHFGFAVDLAFITAYNSDPATYASPVMKFAVQTT